MGNRKPYCSARSTSQSGSPRSDQLPPPAAAPARPRPAKVSTRQSIIWRVEGDVRAAVLEGSLAAQLALLPR